MQQIEKRLVRILKLQIERNLTQQPDQVLDLCEELLRFAVETDDALLYGEAVLYRGKAYLALKKIDIAGTNFEEALGLFKELGDHARVSLSLNALGAVSQLKADRPAAIRYYHAALQAAKQADSGIYLYKPLVNLAQIFFADHTYSKALMYAREAIATSRQWRSMNRRAGSTTWRPSCMMRQEIRRKPGDSVSNRSGMPSRRGQTVCMPPPV